LPRSDSGRRWPLGLAPSRTPGAGAGAMSSPPARRSDAIWRLRHVGMRVRPYGPPPGCDDRRVAVDRATAASGTGFAARWARQPRGLSASACWRQSGRRRVGHQAYGSKGQSDAVLRFGKTLGIACVQLSRNRVTRFSRRAGTHVRRRHSGAGGARFSSQPECEPLLLNGPAHQNFCGSARNARNAALYETF
jgi:hypothetical protein